LNPWTFKTPGKPARTVEIEIHARKKAFFMHNMVVADNNVEFASPRWMNGPEWHP
jgi:hypothetical protein